MDEEARGLSDNCWVCVAGYETDTIREILGLSPMQKVGWASGLAAVYGDFWDADFGGDAALSRVFITPPVREWTFLIGGWLGASGRPGLTIDELCLRLTELSLQFGAAHAFVDQARMDWYQWVV